MVQTALDNQDVLAPIRKRKLPAIGNITFRLSEVSPDQVGGQVDTLEPRESQPVQRVQPVSAAAKYSGDFRHSRKPFFNSQF